MTLSKLSVDKLTKYQEFYKKNPWNSRKFVDIAEKQGLDRKEASKFLKKEVVHDQLKPEQRFIPIVSKTPGGWQMDTFINDKVANGLNYLMFININTRKAHAYPMVGKGTSQVLQALDKFVEKEPSCRSIASDEDPAYLSAQVVEWMHDHDISYTTTKDDNHNNLGIINRFMRTIRDMAVKRGIMDEEAWGNLYKSGTYKSNYTPKRTIKAEEMQELIDAYNGAPHRMIGKAPNDFTDRDELDYIQKNKTTMNPYNFKPGDTVRIVEDNKKMGKRRFNVSSKAYTIDSKIGNMFNVVSKDKSSNEYPGYRLVKAKGKTVMAQTLKNGKRGNIEEILEYRESDDKYKVRWEGGVEQYIPAKNLREGNPSKLSRIEREYWVRHPPIPAKIRKWF